MQTEIKFSQDEVQKVTELRKASSDKVVEFGQIRLEIFLAKQRLEELYKLERELENSFTTLQQDERGLVEELNKKYGVGVLDLESGVFKPAPNE